MKNISSSISNTYTNTNIHGKDKQNSEFSSIVQKQIRDCAKSRDADFEASIGIPGWCTNYYDHEYIPDKDLQLDEETFWHKRIEFSKQLDKESDLMRDLTSEDEEEIREIEAEYERGIHEEIARYCSAVHEMGARYHKELQLWETQDDENYYYSKNPTISAEEYWYYTRNANMTYSEMVETIHDKATRNYDENSYPSYKQLLNKRSNEEMELRRSHQMTMYKLDYARSKAMEKFKPWGKNIDNNVQLPQSSKEGLISVQEKDRDAKISTSLIDEFNKHQSTTHYVEKHTDLLNKLLELAETEKKKSN